MRMKIGDEYSHGIYEVYFDEHGGIDGWTECQVSPRGDTIKELEDDLQRFLGALDKPILDYETGRPIDG